MTTKITKEVDDLASAERSIARHPAGRQRGGMDEATIDCWCGAPGAVEIQCQMLSDQLAWEIYLRLTRCTQHSLGLLESLINSQEEHNRIVLMPLN